MTAKRFHFGYVLGDTGLIDEQAEHKWFIENCCNITDLKKNWITICDKLNEIADENEQLKERVKDWHQRTFKAHEYFNILEKIIDEVCNDEISNQIWKEYEKREKLIE